jgi:hypothetical protein
MTISERKIDYLFNQNIAPDIHNTPHAIQNAQQMQRLGFYNISLDRNLLRDHLLQIIQNSNNILERFTRTFIAQDGKVGESEIEIRESPLCGRSGKFAKVKSSWEIIPTGERRFISAELYGG